MLRVEELMVGDFILVERSEGIYGGPVWKQPGRVLEIYQDEIRVLFADENDNEYDEILTFLPNEVNGLPITPEILKKNGFGEQRFERMSVWSILGFSIELDFSTWKYYWANGDVEISSVHELQHCLKLCGIDKTIEL